MKPVYVFLDGEELLGWTEMTLTRNKENLTGELEIGIFMNYVPDKPILVDACRGREITVYIGGNLAFYGIVDKRTGTGARSGDVGTDTVEPQKSPMSSEVSLSIGPNEYTVKLSARGKTKYLIDSSHQHPTTNMMQPTTREVVEKLCEPWQIDVEWLGTEIKLDKVRFRDGARVVDELHRVCSENCYYMYETRDGKLRVTDDTGRTEGDPLVLGTNILKFSAGQSENTAKAKIKVKGQRTKKDVFGEDAVIQTVIEIEDQWVGANLPITVQHYGDATPEALERRGRFEANKRSAASKEITLDVFHIQTPSGEPWDIGQLHYVEIPPEGIYDVFECTSLVYNITIDDVYTTLTLSPPPVGAQVRGGTITGGLPENVSSMESIGRTRRLSNNVTFAPGRYPAPWSGPSLLMLPLAILGTVLGVTGKRTSLLSDGYIEPKTPALKLPANYRGKE